MSTSRVMVEAYEKNLALLLRADVAYYVESEPFMADSEYDALHRSLLDMEEMYPELKDGRSDKIGFPEGA